MSILTDKIDKLLSDKQLSRNKLALLIGYDAGSLNKMIKGEKSFAEDKIQKIAPILEIPPEQIKGWILADKYPENVLKRALEVKQEVKPEAGMLILTAKIDEILKEKGLSRTRLSNLIGYSQGKLNEMIKGVEPMSPLVVSKIAPVLEVSEEEITSWIVAGKHPTDALRLAVGGIT